MPRAVTADRGYGETKVDAELLELGVHHVAIPRKGRPGAHRLAVESARRFRTLIKWRTGSEGRISHLKHSWGWERTMLDGIEGRLMVRLGCPRSQRHQDRRADRRARTEQAPRPFPRQRTKRPERGGSKTT